MFLLIGHLFALSHFINTANIAKRPLYACFMEMQKACDTVQRALCGASWSPLASGPLSWQ